MFNEQYHKSLNTKEEFNRKVGVGMGLNKKYIGIIGLALVSVIVIVIVIVIVGYTRKDEYIEGVDKEEAYIEDDYEKFLQEKVLPDMIKNNNEIQSCELDIYGNDELVTEEIDLGDGVIELEEDNFIAALDELHINLNKYVGREISYEGVVYKIDDEKNPAYIVGRYFDESHEDHSHENFFGLQGIYDGQWPETDTWLQVKGIITKNEFNGENLPAIKIEELVVKSKN